MSVHRRISDTALQAGRPLRALLGQRLLENQIALTTYYFPPPNRLYEDRAGPGTDKTYPLEFYIPDFLIGPSGTEIGLTMECRARAAPSGTATAAFFLSYGAEESNQITIQNTYASPIVLQPEIGLLALQISSPTPNAVHEVTLHQKLISGSDVLRQVWWGGHLLTYPWDDNQRWPWSPLAGSGVNYLRALE